MSFREEATSFCYQLAVFGDSPLQRDDFHNRIDAISSRRVRKAAAKAIAVSSVITSPLARKYIARPYEKAGLDVLGMGWWSIAVADGDESIEKIHYKTTELSEAEKRDHIDQLYSDQEIILNNLGHFAVPQTFHTRPFPRDPRLSVISAKQPRVYGEPLDPTQPPDSALDFLNACGDMYKKTAILPDIVGAKNAFITEGGVKLVDTLPLFRDRVTDAGALRNGLAALRHLDILPSGTTATTE